jgi:hypothetical protein
MGGSTFALFKEGPLDWLVEWIVVCWDEVEPNRWLTTLATQDLLFREEKLIRTYGSQSCILRLDYPIVGANRVAVGDLVAIWHGLSSLV